MARKGRGKGQEEEGERENITAHQVSNASKIAHVER